MIEVELVIFIKSVPKCFFVMVLIVFIWILGDKGPITRELECWDKVSKVPKKLGNDIKLTGHIMSVSGNHGIECRENFQERCIDEGFEIICVHPRSFKSFENWKNLKKIWIHNQRIVKLFYEVSPKILTYFHLNLLKVIQSITYYKWEFIERAVKSFSWSS